MRELSEAVRKVEQLRKAGGDLYPVGVVWGTVLGWQMPNATGRELKLVRKMNNLLNVSLATGRADR